MSGCTSSSSARPAPAASRSPACLRPARPATAPRPQYPPPLPPGPNQPVAGQPRRLGHRRLATPPQRLRHRSRHTRRCTSFRCGSPPRRTAPALLRSPTRHDSTPRARSCGTLSAENTYCRRFRPDAMLKRSNEQQPHPSWTSAPIQEDHGRQVRRRRSVPDEFTAVCLRRSFRPTPGAALVCRVKAVSDVKVGAR